MVSITKITPTRPIQPNKLGSKHKTKNQQSLQSEHSELKDKKNDEILPIKHIDEKI